MPRKTTKRIFVDTSGWANLADRGQPLHAATLAIYQTAHTQKRHITTTSYVLAELVPLLDDRLHVPRQEIWRFVDAIKASPLIEVIYVSKDIDDQAWDLLKSRSDKEWSLVDATSFVVMRQLAVTEALTTDHHFDQAGFARLPSGQ